jgi:hypothetical protein
MRPSGPGSVSAVRGSWRAKSMAVARKLLKSSFHVPRNLSEEALAPA